MTESFEDARIFAQVIMSDCDAPIISRLQKAHDHEMEQLRRSRFREGYVAGQRSMDAAHYLLKLRLQGLRFGDGSHENLSRLAYAIYPCPTGWGKESCEGLRDKLIELLGGVHDEPAPIPASRCACDADCDCGHGNETAVAYDELGNERHKAVCRLREFVPMIGHKPTEEASKLIRCITGNDDSHVACGNDLEETRDRLIHLLGGDTEPTSQKSPILANSDGEDCGEVTITDELRKFKGHINAGLTPEMVLSLRAEINYIADRIDEQAKRDRESEQLRIEKLVEQRDEARQECDNLLDLLRDAAVDFEYASYSWNYALIVGENITIKTERNRLLKERDELRKSLREIAERVGIPHDVDLDEYGDDLVAKATLGKIDSTHEYIGALEWQRDRQRKLLDEYDETHMILPVDANGESVHVGDIMEYAEGGKPKEVIAVSDTEVFLVDDGPRCSSLCVHHAPVDTAESIVRDIHLGKVTDSQAVERIRALP